MIALAKCQNAYINRKEILFMTSNQIWSQANEYRELIRSINHALCEGGDINGGMNELKQRIPCLFGIDADRRALVFRSTDDGMVAVSVGEQDGTFALALATNIMLEPQEDAVMGMQEPEM